MKRIAYHVVDWWHGYYILIIVTAMILMVSGYKAHTEEHQHPQQDVELHIKFYSKWMKPDNPKASCCNLSDCYPTEARYVNGNVFGRRREDGKWLLIPPQKIEMNRDNPDGRNHMCAPSPQTLSYGSYPEDTVFCFTLGGGT